MPRRSKNKTTRRPRSRPSLNNMMANSVKIPFNFVLTHTYSAATSVSTNFRPSVETLLSNIGQNFEFYRFIKLVFKALPASQVYDFTYYPSNESSPLTDGFANISLSSLNRVVSAAQTVPVSMSVPKRLLYQTPEDWWSTNTSSSIPTQGRFVSATPASATTVLYFQVMGIIEFKAMSFTATDLSRGSVSNGSTPVSSCQNPATCRSCSTN